MLLPLVTYWLSLASGLLLPKFGALNDVTVPLWVTPPTIPVKVAEFVAKSFKS